VCPALNPLLHADARQRDAYEATPLIYAAWYGHAECVSSLLEAGANKEARTSAAVGGFTPLLAAARADWPECCRLLVSAGADATARGEDGKVRSAACASGAV